MNLKLGQLKQQPSCEHWCVFRFHPARRGLEMAIEIYGQCLEEQAARELQARHPGSWRTSHAEFLKSFGRRPEEYS